MKHTAVAYYRTSSAANVGADKDSLKRQQEAVQSYAKANHLEVVGEYYDAAVSGADLIEDRPGFSALLDEIESTDVRIVIVEGIDRLARGMEAGVLGLASLRARDVKLVDISGTDLTDDVDEMTEAMISISLVFATLEKKRLVKKLRGARDRKSADVGHRVEGRKAYKETDPDLAAAAKRLARKPRGGNKPSLRKIAVALASEGYVRQNGEQLHPQTVANIIQ